LVAVGDEEGWVRLLDSASSLPSVFSKTYLSFRPHDNAIMDLNFSDDDRLLATGSGDQCCRIIDMPTQETLHVLSGHKSSIKRVCFQPEAGNRIVASCSRDGNVNIWDLRTSNIGRSSQQICRPLDTGSEEKRVDFNRPALLMKDSIRGAHTDQDRCRKVVPSKGRSSHRRDEASVTSLVFLGGGRQHLLATSSEADATVKLWDMRTTYDTRRARPLPLSTTQQPRTHENHRRFGLTSMTMSGDGARLYTLCRDHTIYVYSTSHLILGSAPELAVTSSRPRRAGGAEGKGLGPIYGLRHRQLQATTFYVKLSLRKAMDDQTEILAAGSGNDCAVVFPTNERYLGSEAQADSYSWQAQGGRPRLQRFGSESDVNFDNDDDIPIYQTGTALIRGHSKEVTAVTWTSEGQLVTASDDCRVRCWREGEEARKLRTEGEGEGRRWMVGWADVEGSYDADEFEETE
jgi:WD40 repeat protein